MPQPSTRIVLQLVVWIACSIVFASCGRWGQTRNASADDARSHASKERIAGALDNVQSAVFDHDPIPGADVHERVSWAIQRARDTTNESYDADEAIAEIDGAPEKLTPIDAASGRVEMATHLGEIAATPSPSGAPASIEDRRRAEERNIPPGHLRLYVPKERERYDIKLYDTDGRMQLKGVFEASKALRDHNSQIIKPIHPRLLAMLYLVGQHFDKELEIISGYRVRGVNASRGSRHGFGKAADFRISGVNIYTIAAYAESTFAELGMGVYPTSGFVHMDTRKTTFYWRDNSGPGQRTRTRARSIDRRGDPSKDPTLRSVHLTEQEIFGWR